MADSGGRKKSVGDASSGASPRAGPDVPRITTDRLILRGHAKEDFQPSFAMWSDESVVRFIGGVPASREAAWARLLRYGGLWRFLGYGYWVMEDRRSGRFVGEAGFADFKRLVAGEFSGLPEAGWAIAPCWAGRGYASEAMRAALEWLDRARPGAGSFCMISPANAASIKVAEKLGYLYAHAATYKDAPMRFYRR